MPHHLYCARPDLAARLPPRAVRLLRVALVRPDPRLRLLLGRRARVPPLERGAQVRVARRAVGAAFSTTDPRAKLPRRVVAAAAAAAAAALGEDEGRVGHMALPEEQLERRGDARDGDRREAARAAPRVELPRELGGREVVRRRVRAGRPASARPREQVVDLPGVAAGAERARDGSLVVIQTGDMYVSLARRHVTTRIDPPGRRARAHTP